MGLLKRKIAKAWASAHVKNTAKWKENPIESQEKWLKYLINKAKNTQFGKDYSFSEIKTGFPCTILVLLYKYSTSTVFSIVHHSP